MLEDTYTNPFFFLNICFCYLFTISCLPLNIPELLWSSYQQVIYFQELVTKNISWGDSRRESVECGEWADRNISIKILLREPFIKSGRSRPGSYVRVLRLQLLLRLLIQSAENFRCRHIVLRTCDILFSARFEKPSIRWVIATPYGKLLTYSPASQIHTLL